MVGRSRGRLTLVPDPRAAPRRKPMAAARQVTLFEKEVRVTLSGVAIELLFDGARVLSEGHCQGRTYFGSTMITMDLARAHGRVREECDAFTATLVARLVAHDPRVKARVQAIAQREAEERAGRTLTGLVVDVVARGAGSQVHVDLDVEARIATGAARHRLGTVP